MEAELVHENGKQAKVANYMSGFETDSKNMNIVSWPEVTGEREGERQERKQRTERGDKLLKDGEYSKSLADSR